VTAEGVETIEQARLLKSMGCDSLQGFYFSQPVTADRIAALRARRWNLADAAETGPDGGLDSVLAALPALG
jgi:predicted signal transduction protein with EAL and GGDEF domain